MGIWDPNPARNNSVTVVLCSCTHKEKFDDIQAILDKHNAAFKALKPVAIHRCTLAEYDKRTWTRGCNLHVIAEKPSIETILQADLGKKSGFFIENKANASPYYFDSEHQTLTPLAILPPYQKAFNRFMVDKTSPQKCHLSSKEIEKMQRWAGMDKIQIKEKHLSNVREIYAVPSSNVCSRH